MWYEVAQADTPDELKDATPDVDVPYGTRLRLDMEAYPIAPVADLFGMEWVVQQLADVDAEVTDVYSSGWDKAHVEMRTTGTPLIIIIGVIAAILAAVAYLIHELRLFSQEPIPGGNGNGGWSGNLAEMAKWFGIGAIAIATVKGVSLLAGGKK